MHHVATTEAHYLSLSSVQLSVCQGRAESAGFIRLPCFLSCSGPVIMSNGGYSGVWTQLRVLYLSGKQ
jgi:hypothetical protein